MADPASSAALALRLRILHCARLILMKLTCCDDRNFYQQRLDKIRNAELAKRNRERIKNPNSFPSAPTGDPA